MKPIYRSIQDYKLQGYGKLCLSVTLLSTLLTAGCGVTTRLEPYEEVDVVMAEGEQVVVLARKHHTSHEAETSFTECISDNLASGRDGVAVHPTTEFEDMLYPWFEPSTAPLTTEELPELFNKAGVWDQIATSGVRYVVWLDGSTDRVASGGGISCAAGVGGAGCLGLAWWEDDAKYEATIWDLKEISSAGTINADVTGRSVMPAIVVPLPFIARTKTAACKGLADQLKVFLAIAVSGAG
jgi:hypothetical protein